MAVWNAHTTALSSLLLLFAASIRLDVDRHGLYSCSLSAQGVVSGAEVPVVVDTGSVSHVLIPPTCVVNGTTTNRTCRHDDGFPFRVFPHRGAEWSTISFASGAVVGGWTIHQVDAGMRCNGDVPHRVTLSSVLIAAWMNEIMARAVKGYGGIIAASPAGLQRWHPDEAVHFLPTHRAPSSAVVSVASDEPLRIYVEAIEIDIFATPIREWCIIDSASPTWIAVPRLHVYTLRRGWHDNTWSTTVALKWGNGCTVDLPRRELPTSPHEGGVAIAKGAVPCVLGAPFVRATGMTLRKEGGGAGGVLLTLGVRDGTCNADDTSWRWLIAAVLLALIMYAALRWRGVIPQADVEEED